jgi:hypothetical protein
MMNRLKQTGHNVEGNSITQEILNYNNSSPYNGSFEYDQEQTKIKESIKENMNRFYDEGWNTLKKNREETRKKLLYNQAKNKKYIKQSSESVNQERAAFKLIENYPNSKIMGKSKTGNLIFKNKDKKYYITSNGKFI